MDTNEPAMLSDRCPFLRPTASGIWMPVSADTQLPALEKSWRALGGHLPLGELWDYLEEALCPLPQSLLFVGGALRYALGTLCHLP